MEKNLFQSMMNDAHANEEYLKCLLEEVALESFLSYVHHDQVISQYDVKINEALDNGDEQQFYHYAKKKEQYERVGMHE